MEQFEHGIDWTRRPQLAHNFEKCTVRAIVKKATEKRVRDTDPGGRLLLGIFGGGVRPSSSNPDPISDQKSHFPHPFSDQTSKIHTRFQTWPLDRNHVIITWIRAQTQKNSSNPFRVRIFLFLSYSFGIETINTFIHSRSSFENHTRFQTKMQGKIYTRLQTKNNNNNKNNNNFYCTQSRIL